MLDELRGIALKDVVDGNGKRLGINVRPVLATELEVILEFPPFRGRFTAWDSSRALRWLRVQCWTYPPLVVDG